MIRVVLPAHLRTLARVEGEVKLDVKGPVTQRSVLDALEASYPMLRGTIRDHVTLKRRPFVRFFACEQDLSHEPQEAPLPDTVATGAEPFFHRGSHGRRLGDKKGGITMRFMILVKATKDSEAGVMPSEQLLTEMGKFNEELVKAGVMLAGEGLQPSSKGARVKFSGSKRTVIDGPFAETKELIAGFWLWQVKSKKEAIEWVKRCPNPMKGESEIEIRQVFEAEDFGAEFTPELRAQEERLRAQSQQLKKATKK